MILHSYYREDASLMLQRDQKEDIQNDKGIPFEKRTTEKCEGKISRTGKKLWCSF